MQNKPNCEACNAPLLWRTVEPSAKNPQPKPSPIDAQSSIGGNIRLLGDEHYKVVTKDELETARATGEILHTSHFATCPNAQRFRRK